MMFVYYGCRVPAQHAHRRGFYRDGIWSDTGFMRWGQISAVSWKESGAVTLILISHFRQHRPAARVPAHLYGQARRVLRDKVRERTTLPHRRAGLDLGESARRQDTDLTPRCI